MSLTDIFKNILTENDTFRFKCTHCGKCCKDMDDPVSLNACDYFRLIKHLSQPATVVIRNYLAAYIHPETHLPIITIRKENGSCVFLKDNHCTIQDCKPIVCRIFPLGRFYDKRDGMFHYMEQTQTCSGTGDIVKVSDFLKENRVSETDGEEKLWADFYVSAIVYMQTLYKTSLNKAYNFFEDFTRTFYGDVDTSKSCSEHIKENIAKIKSKYPKIQ